MSEAKFTKGPWGVFDNGAGSIEIVFKDGNSLRGREYLRINPVSSKDDCECIHSGETAEANAHLIAASPKMYEMLSKLVNESRLVYGDDYDEVEKLLKQVRGE